jgi:hypothetical protein
MGRREYQGITFKGIVGRSLAINFSTLQGMYVGEMTTPSCMQLLRSPITTLLQLS